MKSKHWLLIIGFCLTLMIGAFACEQVKNAIEEATGIDIEKMLEDATGMQWELDESQFGVDTPKNWEFIAAVNLDDENKVKVLDQSFTVDLNPYVSLDPTGWVKELKDKIQFQIVIVKKENVASENRLRFATKLVFKDYVIKIDPDKAKLGDSAGPAGTGWYAIYFSTKEFGFLTGTVKDCNGDAKADILVLASDGPFFTKTASNGSWAIPSLGGKPASINFQDGTDCSGSTAGPVTDEGNPKPGGETPPLDNFGDGTTTTDTGESGMEGNPSESGNDNLDFESGTTGWSWVGSPSGSDTLPCFGVSDQGYSTFFPDGTQTKYAYITTGGNALQSCTVTRTLTVPEGKTTLEVKYDFVSQEYPEWVGSAYNDIFTFIIQGEYNYVINRTVNNIATTDDWEAISGVAAETAKIKSADDTDSKYNDTGDVFDGHLKAGGSTVPRGPAANDNKGKVATYTVTPGAPITLLITVSDVADAYWDSAAIIDYVAFK